MIRGNFIPNYSSVMVFPLLSNRTSLYIYGTPAYKAIAEIFDRHCKPFYDCTEAPTVWVNLTFDEVHLPTSAETFDPPNSQQPQWHSFYLFDLIDHHHIIYGEDFIKRLYRPDPRKLTLKAASEFLRIVRTRASGQTKPPVGFGTILHWQAIKMIRLLQLHFSPGTPNIGWQITLSNYGKHVPDFPSKAFGEKVWKDEIATRYPADRKKYSDSHAAKCKSFIEDGCDLLAMNR